MKDPNIIWASVVLVVVLVAGVVTLVLTGHSTESILTLVAVVVAPILVGFGAVYNQKLDKVQDQVNGNNSRLLNQLLDAHRQAIELAKQAPVDPPADTTTTTTTVTMPTVPPWPGA